MWQEEQRVATLMATTPTLLSRRAVSVAGPRGTPRGAIVGFHPETRLPAAKLRQLRNPSAPHHLNQPAAPSTEVESPAAHPVTPAEDERDVHIRILVTALQYVLDHLPQDHHARHLCAIAANPRPGVLLRD
ncbi:hypothetical protein MRX96_043068 [Rhipicephalus microplus]